MHTNLSLFMSPKVLKSFEETEKFHYKPKTDQVMKIESPSNSVNCFGRGRQGYFIKDCPDKAKALIIWRRVTRLSELKTAYNES